MKLGFVGRFAKNAETLNVMKHFIRLLLIGF